MGYTKTNFPHLVCSVKTLRYLFAAAIIAIAGHPATTRALELCDHNDLLVTTTPAPPPTADRWRIYRQELAAATQINVDLILLGDSLAELWDPIMWKPRSVLNLGVGGDDTQRVLWRLASQKLRKLKPRHVLIILGTNNLGLNNACAITEGLKRVFERTAILWPTTQITFLEIPPKGKQFAYRNDDRLEVNDSIRRLRRVKTLNVDNMITCDWKEPCVNYREDNIHFTEAGYRTLLEAVRPVIFGR